MKLSKKISKIYLNICYKLGLHNYARKLISKNLRLDKPIPEDIIFKLAETTEEFEQAFSILYENYVEEGYMQTNESKLRITAYHLLPASMTLICKKENEVIATCSIIKSSKFGMPTSEIIDIDKILPNKTQVAEIGSLAVKKSFQNKSGSILFPFIKFILVYCRDYLKLEYTVISHHPKWLIFYHLLFGFTRINPKTIAEYNFANGAPVDFQILKIKDAPDLHCSNFYQFTERTNVWKFIWKLELKNFKYPERTLFVTDDNILTPKMIHYFFVKKTNVFQNLPQNQKNIIQDIYRSKHFENIFGFEVSKENNQDFNRRRKRRNNRLSVNLKVSISINDTLVFGFGEILNASLFGIQLSTSHDLSINETIQLKIKINEYKIIQLSARVRRKISPQIYGATITGEATEWYHEIVLIAKNFEDLDYDRVI